MNYDKDSKTHPIIGKEFFKNKTINKFFEDSLGKQNKSKFN